MSPRHPLSLLALASAALLACGSPGGGGGLTDAVDDNSSGLCTPADVSCVDAVTRAICRADGSGWTEAPCPADHGCDAGQCRPQVCSPGASAGVCASPMTHERCNDAGTGWELATCPAGNTCRQGICAGQICVPGSRICAGFVRVQECNAAGDGWVDVETCGTGGACFEGVCLSPCEVNVKGGSYLGCEYWAMDLDNVEEAETQTVGLVVSVPTDSAQTEVRIASSATGELLTAASLGVPDLFVTPGEVEVFRLPGGYDVDGTGLTTNTFHLRTTAPVTVHQFNPLNGDGVYSNDASLLLPSQVIGGEYLVMSWPHRADAVATLRGFATIIATQPGATEVQVTPTASVAAGPAVAAIPAGTTRVFSLAEGQAINLETDGSDHGDLTGSIVRANRPITVIGGHECANVPVGISACDHIESQLFPVDTWGTRYVCDAFAPRSDSQIDIWRVMGGANGVTVRTEPPVPGYEQFELQLGTWVQFAGSTTFEVIADGPVLVAHYLSGSSYPGADKVCDDNGFGRATGLGNPAFTLAVPSSRYLTRYAVLVPDGYSEDYLNIVARPGAEIAIDGAPMTAPFVAVGDSEWALARQPVAPGVHTVTGSSPFGLTAYGYDCDVSYAYPGGLQLQTSVRFDR